MAISSRLSLLSHTEWQASMVLGKRGGGGGGGQWFLDISLILQSVFSFVLFLFVLYVSACVYTTVCISEYECVCMGVWVLAEVQTDQTIPWSWRYGWGRTTLRGRYQTHSSPP